MKSFYEYLSDLKREYKYKIKLAVPVTDDMMDRLENVLKRYDAIEVSTPKRGILQHNKVDFPDAGPVETWSIDITTERPLVIQSLRDDLQKYLNVSERLMRVRGENEPNAVEERMWDEIEAIEKVAAKDGLEPTTLLDTPEVPDETVPAYGNDYNQSLLNYLAQVQANRAEELEAKLPGQSMFGWLNDIPATEDGSFNADHDGVRPVSGSTLKATDKVEKPAPTANTGNFDSTIKHASKTYLTKDGKAEKLEGKKK